MIDGRATQDEIRRVHRYECQHQGHSWTPVEMWQKEIPEFFICSHCGLRIKVVEGD